ncbi:MAG: hypothetical protein OXR73_18970 [Myxococcales bacterium]|nr:hypothetical protein [Myxococcales bacterium]
MRAEARVRLWAAALAIPAALWLFSVSRAWLMWVFGGAALAFGALWLRRQQAARPEALDPTDNRLDLTREGLAVIAEGVGQGVAWCNAGDISIDHDALVVCVARKDGPELRIEPQYGSLGLQELAETIYEYSRRAKGCAGAQDD